MPATINAASFYYSALAGQASKSPAAASSSLEDYEALKAELAAVKQQLASEQQAHAATKRELEQARGAAPAAAAAAPKAAADEEFDLFADEEDDGEHEREIERRAKEALAKSAAKNAEKGIVMKSAVVIDVKPWEDTTDLVELERLIREIAIEGLEWKAAKLIPIGYGIKKLSISCHVEDNKVSVDDIQEKIAEFEDFVQSTDVVTFTKL